jgi:protein O-GlcNAc transferase
MIASPTQPPASGVRNQPCRCGSGRKFKHCCANAAGAAPSIAPETATEFNLLLRQGIDALNAGEPRKAALNLSAAIRLHPQSAPAISNLGVALFRLREPQRAITCYRQAIAIDGRFAPAYSNLGQALGELGHAAEAAAALEAATALDPMLADAFVNLGATLRTLGRYPEAATASRRALELRPDDVDAQLNLGNALKEQGLYTEAAAHYRRATELAPADPRGRNNLGETLRDQGDIPSAAHAYQQALEADPKCAAAYSNLLYLYAFTRAISPAAELRLARCYEQRLLTTEERDAAHAAASPSAGVFDTTPLEGRKLRVGIVSAELGTHAVAEFLQPILETLDRSRFHLTLFPTTGRHDARAQRFRELADEFLPLTSLSDEAAVELIRSRQIDVLLDTSGHTLGNRLGVFARRAAPVQATYVGYWSTTGLTEMDYFIADPDPTPAIEAHFSEKLWRLPRLGTTYRGDPSFALDWQPDPEGVIRLGSFNKFGKIREHTIALWSMALHIVPQAVLVLEDRAAHEDESHTRIRAGFAAHGVDPERIRFLPYIPGHERHMLLYNQLDIALDTIPFNSGTTAFDSLWMGVPLLTLEGNTMGGRIAGAALNALGRPEWVAPNAEAFAELVQSAAAALPTDPEARRLQRQAQRDAMSASPLGDAVSLTHALEGALTGMFNSWLHAAKNA